MTCKLCQRAVEKLTEHHLRPRSKLKKGERTPTIWICSPCHRQIHALFTNDELAAHFDTADKLRAEPRMNRFLLWIASQDANKSVKVRR